MEKDQIIVTLTSYKTRLSNLPTVLDTIFAQTLPPDKVVLNLAYDEVLPNEVSNYLDLHNVEIYRVADTKVYKKIIPTLKRYPNNIVICIDDDFLYPKGMIQEFVAMHDANPNNPIGGSHWPYKGLMVPHCGCASLTKSEFLGDFISKIDDDLILHCPCSDIVYAYLSVLNGHPYICTQNEYFLNMQSYNETKGYSEVIASADGHQSTFNYLRERFGELPEFFSTYVGDNALSYTLHVMMANEMENRVQQTTDSIHKTRAYRLGKALLLPLQLLKGLTH